ncbi:hypothetical protein H074_25010 [Amycolatopsis decaplanina DSM 44594]|uniref:Uncharacterized protein n=1 Tax=Amycolatopsis decaplanina DSM 44594 TaxID=1284240 RepID=M2YLR9_9PSEU|nr:hypothetical protein H074_25010 [Amycolatopsis decaplanina DSM 44594]
MLGVVAAEEVSAGSPAAAEVDGADVVSSGVGLVHEESRKAVAARIVAVARTGSSVTDALGEYSFTRFSDAASGFLRLGYPRSLVYALESNDFPGFDRTYAPVKG